LKNIFAAVKDSWEPSFIFVLQSAQIGTGYDGKLRGKLRSRL